MIHYQEKTDEIFKHLHQYRTLRTLFDCLSYEWESTTFEQKEKLLLQLFNSDKSIEFYIEGFQNFYRNEVAHKAYAANYVPQSLRLLVLNVKDEALRKTLHKIYINFGEIENRELNSLNFVLFNKSRLNLKQEGK